MIEERIAEIYPRHLLDVGCQTGNFTSEIAPHCQRVTAVDVWPEYIDMAREKNPGDNIEYMIMSGTDLKFDDSSFDCVIERFTLHHIKEWKKAVDELIRVSSQYIFIGEPIDDLRSEEKQNYYRANTLFLELQREVGYSHYHHLPKDEIIGYIESIGLEFESRYDRYDDTYTFDEFFEPFDFFAQKSDRPDYWHERLEDLRKAIGDKQLANHDYLYIEIRKINI